MLKKRLLLSLLLISVLLLVSGCRINDIVSNAAAKMKAEGRGHGETLVFGQDEVMQTAFFDVKINSAKLVPELSEYVPDDEANLFLVVNVTVTDTFADQGKIPMFYSDFELTWASLEGATVYAETSFAEGQLPDEYEIFKNESKTGDLVYIVPGNVTDFAILFYEYWEDDFVGNTCRAEFTAKLVQ